LQPVKIGIADDNPEFSRYLQVFFAVKPEFQVISCPNNDLDTIKLLEDESIDLLLLSLSLHESGGVGVLQRFQKSPPIRRPKIILFSNNEEEEITSKAMDLGFDYYIVKPFDLTLLARRILELINNFIAYNPKEERIEQKYTEEIGRILSSLNIPDHFKGYLYLRDAILMTVKEPKLINGITKKIYPIVGHIYHSNDQRVERAMRFAIETAWNKGNVTLLHELFGYCVDVKKGKPTNASFIAKVADHIRLQQSLK
jgi:two-component system response regulator (stage 0 sporulation protein A)